MGFATHLGDLRDSSPSRRCLILELLEDQVGHAESGGEPAGRVAIIG